MWPQSSVRRINQQQRKNRPNGGSEGAGAGGSELIPDSPLAVARSVCRARGPLTQRQAQHLGSQRILCCLVVGRLAASYRWRHSWQYAIESHAATDGGFVSGGRRSRALSHSQPPSSISYSKSATMVCVKCSLTTVSALHRSSEADRDHSR